MGGGDSCPGRGPGRLSAPGRPSERGCRSPRRGGGGVAARAVGTGGASPIPGEVGLGARAGGGPSGQGAGIGIRLGGQEICESVGERGRERLGSEYLGMGLAGRPEDESGHLARVLVGFRGQG